MYNHIMETIVDFDPSKVHTTKEEYNAIKWKKPDKPFEIKDEQLSNALIMLDLIQRHEIYIPKNDPDYSVFCHTKPSGKYILSVKGKRYLSYRKSLRSSKFWVEFRAWITLAIAFVSLLLSICSLVLDIISKVQKG